MTMTKTQSKQRARLLQDACIGCGICLTHCRVGAIYNLGPADRDKTHCAQQSCLNPVDCSRACIEKTARILREMQHSGAATGRVKVEIAEADCNGCGDCVLWCPVNAIVLRGNAEREGG